jgi:cardiolipin synthase
MQLKKLSKLRIFKIAAFFLCSSLLGCSSIPILVPDMALKRHRSVNFVDARSFLSAKQSKNILAKLEKNSDVTNIFDHHLINEAEITGSPLVTGNNVLLLVDGPATFDAMLKAIDNAQDNINMETYIIDDDEISNTFANHLIDKKNSGVQVNFIYDSVGSINTPKDFFNRLTNSGINVLEYNPINPLIGRKQWQFNQRDHRKLLVVDGKVAFIGGINISSVYSTGSFPKNKSFQETQSWRDTHIKIMGPVVRQFQNLFMETWFNQKGGTLEERNYYPEPIVEGNDVVRAIGSSPDEQYSQIFSTLLSAINSAETQISLTNAYFVPDSQLVIALKEAVQRGVDTRLILPSKTDSALVFYASRSFYDELLTAGLKIYERQDTILHAKTALIDGVWSTVGSTNMDWRSFVYNQEIDAVILGQDFGKKMLSLYESDLALSKRITLDEWKKRSIFSRLKENFARLWARLL